MHDEHPYSGVNPDTRLEPSTPMRSLHVSQQASQMCKRTDPDLLDATFASPHGTGDAFCAILLGQLLNGRAFKDATALACASVYGLIRATLAGGGAELDIVGAQDEVVEPSEIFAIE